MAQPAATSQRVLIAASGTGGHLFPALAIAKAIKDENPDALVHFVGSGRALEGLVEAAGYVRHKITTAGLKRRGIKGAAEFFFTLPTALLQVCRLFSQFQPDIVIGVGGYVTFLPVVIARLRRVPTWIHEAEKKPGMANFVLAFFASRISTGFMDAEMPCKSKVVYTGQPVRAELLEVRREKRRGSVRLTESGTKTDSKIDSDNVEKGRVKNLLIMGGSQGAQALDLVFADLAGFLSKQGLSIWHQCREENFSTVSEAYRAQGIQARVVTFIDEVAEAYRWADLIVSRSGAGTVMEIGVVDVPAILVPYPYAQGGHQRTNALTLVEAGKALLVEEGDGFKDKLLHALNYLLAPSNYETMRSKEYEPRALDAAQNIARGCLELSSK